MWLNLAAGQGQPAAKGRRDPEVMATRAMRGSALFRRLPPPRQPLRLGDLSGGQFGNNAPPVVEQGSWLNRRIQPKIAFSRFPPVQGDRISFWQRRRLRRIMRVWKRPMSSQLISHKTPGSLAAIDGAFPRT
jgi:hypothetical protein